MVSFPPLAPSAAWMSHMLKTIMENATEEEAVSRANMLIDSPKEFGRYHITNTRGEVMCLSVAVEGGGRQLRTIDKIGGLLLSEHGDWRKNHLRTIEACIGRYPYFRYFSDSLGDIYLNRDIKSLRDFNTAIYGLLSSFLREGISKEEMEMFFKKRNLFERGLEIAGMFKREISSMEIIAAFGKEALLGFLASGSIRLY